MERLLKTTGFIPFLLIVLFNAFVDLGHKIIIQNTVFKIYDGQTQIILTAIVNGLILLPFILLFIPAGFLSDKYPKPRIIRYSAAVAVGLTLIITLSYYFGWFYLSFGMTFLLAVQSAIYSPAKYGYIKTLSGTEQLSVANAWVQACTIVAILLGIFLFSILFEDRLSGESYSDEAQLLRLIAPIGWLLVACSLLEWMFALRLTEGSAGASSLDWGRYSKKHHLGANIERLLSNRIIWLSIIGLSAFWGISQVVLATFPAFAKETLEQTNTVVIQGMLACSGIGIIIGSLIAGRVSRHRIETKLIPIGALGVIATIFVLPWLDSQSLIIADFLLLGTAGGMFIVPLNALIQFHAKDSELGTILAGNNWVQNIVMLSFLILTVLFALNGASGVALLNMLPFAALAVAIYAIWRRPNQ
jgi:acyl-[acyl-carrier-protein]-phospholipid O-acyltransferase/long-chain-fatty-acid--[acyl-carrier-protein] ligase